MTEQFAPRRAQPGQTFDYVGPKEALVDENEIPEGAIALDTEAPEGKRRVVRPSVVQTIKADADGVIRPKSALEVATLDGFGLPVAQSVIREERAAARESEQVDPKATKE